jgi:hypothetical protein
VKPVVNTMTSHKIAIFLIFLIVMSPVFVWPQNQVFAPLFSIERKSNLQRGDVSSTLVVIQALFSPNHGGIANLLRVTLSYRPLTTATDHRYQRMLLVASDLATAFPLRHRAKNNFPDLLSVVRQ